MDSQPSAFFLLLVEGVPEILHTLDISDFRLFAVDLEMELLLDVVSETLAYSFSTSLALAED